jgi:cell fate regulator YaaT (PSP1 superfamily)
MVQEINTKEAGDKKPQKNTQNEPRRTVLVRYGKFNMVGQYRHSERQLPSIMTKVVVQTDRGLEIGEIIAPTAAHNRYTCSLTREKIDSYVKESGPDYPFSRNGRVVRLASVQDLNEQRHIDLNAKKEGDRFRELCKELNMPMKLVDMEHLFGGDRIIYYFMAEGRIDFRDLVRQLGKEFNTRVEMRQIGARDEARVLGDFDTCGLELCCKKFLKVLQPVSMRMAKVQRTTLDPSKISGRCGRLKCCLRYENVGYEELEKKLPKQNQWVLTEQGPGRVLDTMALTQLVKLHLDESGRTIAVNVDELLDVNYDPSKAPPRPPVPERVARPRKERSERPRRNLRDEAPPVETASSEGAAETKPVGQENQDGSSGEGAPKKKRRRRRRRRGPKPSSE